MSKDNADGLEQEDDVLPEAPIADVPRIELEAAVEFDIVAAADLPEAGDAWRRHADDRQVIADFLFFTRQIRARADEAHVALDDVENLRQFVEAVLADEFADFRDAWVVTAQFLEFLPFLLGFRMLAEKIQKDAVGIHVHGTELIAFKRPAALADAFGVVKGRAVRVELDEDGQHKQDGQDDDGNGRADDEVKRTFEHLIAVALEVVARLEYEQLIVKTALDVDVANRHAEEVWNDGDVANKRLYAIEQLDLLPFAQARCGEDDLLYRMLLENRLNLIETAETWVGLQQRS